MRIDENGNIVGIESSGNVNGRKVFHVTKAGGNLFFGSVKMMVDSVEDLDVSKNTIYQRKDWSKPYLTRSGYTINLGRVLQTPNAKKNEEEKV